MAVTVTINNDSKKIWDYFLSKLNNNAYGVAGLLGNLYAESGLVSNNLENSKQAADKNRLNRKITDEEYTELVNTGKYLWKGYYTYNQGGVTHEAYSNGTDPEICFSYDRAGFGLAQWTYWSRKKNLYRAWKSKRKDKPNLSIGDLDFGLAFLWDELTSSYSDLVRILKKSKTVSEASEAVLAQFERPQSYLDYEEALKIV